MDDAVPLESSYSLSCAHAFCRPCLLMYVSTKVLSGQVGPPHLACPDPYCGKPALSEADVEAVLDTTFNRPDYIPPHARVSFPEYRARLNKWLVETDPAKAFCRHCRSNGVLTLRPRSPLPLLLPVGCSEEACDGRSCGRCGLEAHPFRTCASAGRRLNRGYIEGHDCKRCPGCQ
jgi:hypothetical protein